MVAADIYGEAAARRPRRLELVYRLRRLVVSGRRWNRCSGSCVEDGRTLVIRPCIPADWPGYRVDYRLPDGLTECEIQVDNPAGAGRVTEVRLNGIEVAPEEGAARIELPPGPGRHHIQVRLG